MKKIFFLAQLLLVCLLANTALAMPKVVDEAQLLSSQEEQRLVQELEGLEREYGLEAAVVTLDSLYQEDIGRYADYLVNEEMTPGRAGTLVFLQVVESRRWYISTDANLRDTLGSSAALERYSKAILPQLRQGDYAGAYSAYVSQTAELSRYYAKGGSWQDKLKLNEAALIFALFFAFLITTRVRRSLLRSMDNVQEAAAADDYLRQGSFQLLDGHDDYMYSNTVRTPRGGNRNHGGSGGGGGNGGGGGSY